MRHELAYCLGQMRDATALPVLEKVLRDTSDDPIVRHEVGVPKARQVDQGGLTQYVVTDDTRRVPGKIQLALIIDKLF